ncbi:LysR family transcriptional regulator [Streptomyces sp. NBC_01474]|uniref:LysR family transcriptional regulator n=1 Tax=unclassified Streptomyces TaxID=2593676 RepID=UPI002DD8870E|nr:MULTISPECIES: LysR family transcriptional regulator [unclassified Streptomyces]WSD97515.1 LysR family transcriptional regulator [Streptomyces sp. NBC_01474]
MAKDANFTLVQLRYFLAAAELGSMTAAAHRINVSQSAVSTAVHHLERELGVQLLIRRHAKGLELTAAGERFLHELRGFLTHADELAESARSLGADLVGELAVGCFQTLAPFYLPRLLREFGERQPAVRVEVVEGDIPAVQESLRTGACELALLYDMDLDADIECEVLAMAPPYALVPEGHRLAGGGRARLADLADEPMILLDLPASRDYFRSVATKAGVEPRISHRTRSYETVRALVAAGYGWSLLNQRPAHDRTYDGSSVVALPLADPLPALPVVLAKLRGVRLTGRAQAFATACREALRS